ncbi:MAG: TadE family protein [Acidimicrobiia bacterium]
MTRLVRTLRARLAARERASGERGAALVELAIILPLLLTLAFGIVEYGSAWNRKLQMETSACRCPRGQQPRQHAPRRLRPPPGRQVRTQRHRPLERRLHGGVQVDRLALRPSGS